MSGRYQKENRGEIAQNWLFGFAKRKMVGGDKGVQK